MNQYQSISFKEVQESIYSFASFLRKCIVFFLAAIREHIVLFLAIIALCIVSGYYYYRSQPAVYQSEMVCSFNNLHKKTYGEMVQRLNHLAATGSRKRLAALLGITEGQARTITGFEAKNIAGSPLHEDITNEKLPLYFTLRATNADVFPAVEQGLLWYLNTTPYQVLRRGIETERISKKIASLDTSVRKLDDVIDAYTSSLEASTLRPDSAGHYLDIGALFRYREELEGKKLEEMKMVRLQESVELVYGFAPTDRPEQEKGGYLVRIIVGAFLLSVMTVVLKKMWRYGR